MHKKIKIVRKKPKNITNSFNKKKLCIKLNGGLGNHLFQIFSAYSIAKAMNFDFCIDENINLLHISEIPSFFSKLNKINTYEFEKINEKPEDWSSYVNYHVGSVKNNCVLSGYFQNEKYFKKYYHEIKNELNLFSDIDKKNFDKYNNLYYFIHVRRGDFINNNIHFIDLSNYYINAISFIKKLESDAKFLVFSDDQEYIKSKFYGNEFTAVFNNNPIEALYIMSICKGGICANSTFSWWGSYLIENNNKTVIMPKKWINKKKKIEIYPSFAILI